MSKTQIAIDFGGSFTKIYLKGTGLVLVEPTMIVVSGKNGNYVIKAYGNEAKQMLGKTDDNTMVFSPIINGEIKSVEYASALLKYFLNKIFSLKVLRPKIEAIICLPCGITYEQRENYANVCYNAKISNVKLVPTVITSALGGGKFVHTPNTYFIVDIGGSSTDIATVNLNTIIKGCTVGIGGKSMDSAILDAVASEYETLVSLQTAELLKEEIGTLYEKDNQNMEVVGVDVTTQSPKVTLVVADVIREAVLPYFEKIAYAVESTLNMCSPDISADITTNGIFFSGGVSNITGLEDFMRKRLRLPVHIINDASVSSIMGAGKLLSDDKQLTMIINEF